MITLFDSSRKQSSDLRKRILLLVYDAKKLQKDEFSYMQSEVHRLEEEIADFDTSANLTADGDIMQELGCPFIESWAPEAKLTD